MIDSDEWPAKPDITRATELIDRARKSSTDPVDPSDLYDKIFDECPRYFYLSWLSYVGKKTSEGIDPLEMMRVFQIREEDYQRYPEHDGLSPQAVAKIEEQCPSFNALSMVAGEVRTDAMIMPQVGPATLQ